MHRPSGGSRPQAAGSRRNYTRNSNAAFKFHNFVFNEDNQSFCLEEQHGNKKITVLHWKKSEVEKSGSGGSGSTADDGTSEHLLSEETELEESNTTDSPPEIVTYDQAGKTISRQLSKTSSDSTSATKRRTHEVTTSASFPPLSSHANRNAAAAASVSTSTSSSAVPPLSSPPPAPAPAPPLSPSSVSSSHHHPLQHSLTPPTSLLSPSSHFSPALSADCPSPHLSSRLRYHPLSKSTASSSSIATSSSNSSSSAVAANWLHQSLHDLDLTELPYGSFRLPSTSGVRRKATQVRRIVVDEEDDDEDDDDDETDRSDDELSDQEMMAADDSNLFCTYRRYLEQFDRKEQTQPLDLSVKNVMVDDNNNTTTSSRRPTTATHHWNIDSILGLKSPQSSFSKSESVDEMDRAFQSSRSEVLSPSAMISSVKCCSPPAAAAEHYRATTTSSSSSRSSCTVNPFMLPGCSTNATDGVFSPFSAAAPTSRRHERADELRRHHPSSSSYLFDAFLEEEISRLLQQTNAKSPPSSAEASTSTSSSRIYHHHPRTATTSTTSTTSATTTTAPRDEYEDIEERIEDKLRSLHREVLSRKAALERRSRLGGDKDAGSAGQEHLKLHFKLDAARNGSLELFGTEGARQSGSSSRTLSEPNLNQQPFLSPFSSNKGRPPSSQRNQIKRQLEDAFKQNGFLVKVRGGHKYL